MGYVAQVKMQRTDGDQGNVRGGMMGGGMMGGGGGMMDPGMYMMGQSNMMMGTSGGMGINNNMQAGIYENDIVTLTLQPSAHNLQDEGHRLGQQIMDALQHQGGVTAAAELLAHATSYVRSAPVTIPPPPPHGGRDSFGMLQQQTQMQQMQLMQIH